MTVRTYRAELDGNRHNVLIQENEYDCPGQECLSTPESAVKMLNHVFRMDRLAEEHMVMIAMTTRNVPLGLFEVSHGTVCNSMTNTRGIFIRALLCGAAGIIVAHNHPSGSTSPSKDDITAHNQIREAGEIIGVSLMDSLIIGGSGHFSFKENGL